MTSRISPVDPAVAQDKARALLTSVKAKLGVVPNMMKTMAHSPALLEGYLAFSAAGSSARADRTRGQST